MTRGLIRRLIRDGIINPAAVFGGPPTMPTRSLEALREAAILEGMLDDEAHVPCVGHHGTTPHDADWYASCPCGHPPAPVCNRRRELARAADGWNCGTAGVNGGCGGFHTFGQLEFTRI